MNYNFLSFIFCSLTSIQQGGSHPWIYNCRYVQQSE